MGLPLDKTANALLAFAPLITIGLVVLLVWLLKNHRMHDYAKSTHQSMGRILGDKGAYGEFQIYNEIDQLLTGTKYWLFNVYMPRGNGETTEIDVILFHESGIYIFESKNYKGWIFGHEEHPTWTQCLRASRRGSKKFNFFNPLMQNNIHIACFKAWAGEDLGNIPIRSVVLFGNQCELKNLTLTSGRHYVLNRYMFPPLLQHLVETTPPIDTEALTRLYQRAYPLSQVDEATKQQHIATLRSESHIQSRRKHKYNPQRTPPVSTTSVTAHTTSVCPRCGNKLVRRTAKRGTNQGHTFWGCSNYPHCRYTKS